MILLALLEAKAARDKASKNIISKLSPSDSTQVNFIASGDSGRVLVKRGEKPHFLDFIKAVSKGHGYSGDMSR